MTLFSRRTCTALAVALALLHWILAVSAVKSKSPTFDEPTHFAAGYSYWLRQDFRLDPENGSLPQRWATIPLLFHPPHFPSTDSPAWRSASQGEIGTAFLYDQGNDADALLFRGRMMCALFGAALCLVVYFWAASLFGSLGGLIATCAATFCPTLLANGALVTSDVALALFFALAACSVWRMLQRATVLNVLAAGGSVAGVFLAKMSGVLVLGMIAIMLVVRIARRCDARRRHRFAICLVSLAGVGTIAVIAIWAAYGFRFSAVPIGDPYASQLAKRWQLCLANGGTPDRVIQFARTARLLPEAFLFGLAYVRANSDFRPAFLDGNWSVIGFPDFFLRSFFYKTPLPLVALLALAVFALLVWQRQSANAHAKLRDAFYRATPLWTLLLVYGASALTARLNIGHRHIVPLYPALFVSCGAVAFFLRGRRVRWAAPTIGGLLLWQVAESLATAPNYLAYFNEIAGGSHSGYKHLVDSSLDWGQDLPALRKWLDENRREGAPIYLAYFGTAKPEHYRINAISLSPDASVAHGTSESLHGGLYCVSATTIQQVYARPMGGWTSSYEQLYQKLKPEFLSASPSIAEVDPERRAGRLLLYHQLRLARLCAALRHRQPIAHPGYSILVFELSDADLAAALEGPPAELLPQSQVAGMDELSRRRD